MNIIIEFKTSIILKKIIGYPIISIFNLQYFYFY